MERRMSEYAIDRHALVVIERIGPHIPLDDPMGDELERLRLRPCDSALTSWHTTETDGWKSRPLIRKRDDVPHLGRCVIESGNLIAPADASAQEIHRALRYAGTVGLQSDLTKRCPVVRTMRGVKVRLTAA